jgi:hypothetical protein
LTIERDILKDLNLSTGSNIDGDPDIQQFMKLARIKMQTCGKPNSLDEKSDTDGLTIRQHEGTETLE